jgi:Na+/proline symporter
VKAWIICGRYLRRPGWRSNKKAMEAGLFHLVDKGIIVVYFAAMIAIGVLLCSRMQSFDDFLIAGRKMTAPLLICTALVPVMAAFYWPHVKRRAGQAAALTGFFLVVGYYLLTGVAGDWNEAAYAYIWSGRILAWDLTLNQDFGILYILPAVIVVFVAAQLLPGGRRT